MNFNPKNPPDAKQYDEARHIITSRFCPPIYACKKCGWPVAEGYACTWCDDKNPNEE